jgi:hypothetical protein
MKTSNKIPQIMQTYDYDMFDMHGYNRRIHKNDPVEESMRRVGFMPSSAIQCVKNGGGKLKIIRGHHRFTIAKKLGLPIYYIIDESNTDIFELEGASTGAWNSEDFAYARCQAGDKDIQYLMKFKDDHKLTLGAAASLVYGQSAGSGNALKEIKSGRFRIGDMAHAKQVVRITDMLRSMNVEFATSTAFVGALSAALRIPELDYDKMMHQASTRSYNMNKRGTVKEYLQEIEALYNYGARDKRLAVAFRAVEVGRTRSVTAPKAQKGSK